MNNGLKKLFVKRLVGGLERQSITKCSEWSVHYRMMGQPFPGAYSYDHHPWCKEMTDCEAETTVGMKAAQMGYSEVALNKAFYTIDILKASVLYVLPASTPDASDFSSSRFDPALEMSPHLRNMFSEVKNVGLKRAGNASLYIRGSRSRSQVKSIPASQLIFDELDEMNQDNVVLARERSSGQNIMQELMISTPRVENIGIDLYWQQSTQEAFFFKCPHCSRLVQLTYPKCLIITSDDPLNPKIEDSHLICPECKNILDNNTKPEWLGLSNTQWVPERTNRNIRGFRVNQLYSMAQASRPAVLAMKALRSSNGPTEEQEFHNSNLGLCHTVEGARVTDENLQDAIKRSTGYSKFSESQHNSWKAMGVDVGPKFLHVEITEYKANSKKTVDINLSMDAKVLFEGKVEQFEELDRLMLAFRIMMCVVDAQPEKRKAMEFAQRFYGRVRICFYADTINIRDVGNLPDKDDFSIVVGRTVWMDTSLGRFKQKSIRLPIDTSFEYREQMKAPVRSYELDKHGNAIGRYLSGNQADHFAHARNYNEIALALGMSKAKSQNVENLPI